MNHESQLNIGEWHIDGRACRVSRGNDSIGVEPKVMDLLLLLAERAGQVISREEIQAALWPNVIVGEDTLARAVSKLRNALSDDPKNPAYIETVPKRGYRLIAEVSPIDAEPGQAGRSQVGRRTLVMGLATVIVTVVLAAILMPSLKLGDNELSETDRMIGRADDFYMRFTRPDNEAAIDLYERIIALDPDDARAQAGLANALVQRVIRWPQGETGVSSLGAALEAGLTTTDYARDLLERARSLSERAVRLEPENAEALKALGLVYAASGMFDEAREQYEHAIRMDENAWEPLLNLGEIASLENDPEQAAEYFVRAYHVMEAEYDREPQRIGPWHPATGVTVAETYEILGDRQEAEIWYRRVLRLAPYEPAATAKLALILASSGELKEAIELCRGLVAVGSGHESCDALLAQAPDSP